MRWITRKRSMAITAIVSLVAALGLVSPAAANHGNQRLEVTPEVASRPQTADHMLTATLYQGSTNTAGSANNSTGPIVVDFSIESGPNQGETYSCTIVVGSSNCSTTYQGDEGIGTDTIRASIRGDAVDQAEGRYAGPTDCPTTPAQNEPGEPSSGTEEDCVEGTPQPGTTAENQGDPTDVVEVDWTQSVSGNVCIDAEPNSDTNPSGSSHAIQVKATDGTKVTDTSGEFDCSGAARAGLLVDLQITDDEPNAFFESVNGQTTNPSGGGPNQVTCTTNGNGECVVSIRTVSATAEGTNEVTASVRGTTPDDVNALDNEEAVQKTWQRSGEVSTIEASPEADTNEIGRSHAVTAQTEDRFGNPVGGIVVSFQVTAGPHANNDLDNNGNTPNGYFGQCTTNVNGTCSQSYVGSETGNDTITAFQDDDSDFQYDPAVGDLGDQPADQVEKTWVDAGQGTRTVRVDMETDPNSNNTDENGACDADRDPPINENQWQDRSADNQVARNSAHKICAERFGPNDVAHSGPVTFRITSGPGHFTDATGRSDLGREVTVGESEGGYNVTYLSSIETGNTVVEAIADNARDTGTAVWVANPETARTIDLTPDGTTRTSGDEHEVTATVTDKFGNPVPGVTVSFTEDGAGRFVNGGSSTTRTTGADGSATARTTSGASETGSQQITASIDPGRTECEEPENSPQAGDPAGRCTDSVTHTWSEKNRPNERAQCSDEGVICGDDDDDVITGTDGDDVIYTFGGNDTVDGGAGDDVIYLGSGDDIAVGGTGDDTIRGGEGNDTIRGGAGRDVLRGGSGGDTLAGGSDADVLRGGSGDDVIRGNKGFDVMRGGFGRDLMRGGKHNDTIKGGRSNDAINGDRGHDALFGNRGHDALNGGRGNDRCRGGRGSDTVRNCER